MTKFENDIDTVLNNLKNFGSTKGAVLENIVANFSAVLADIKETKTGYSNSDFKVVGQGVGDISRLVFLNVTDDTYE